MTTWAFEMLDRLSGPARAADKALEALERQLKGVDQATRVLNQGQRQSQLLTAQGFRYDRIKLALQRDQLRMQRDMARESRAGQSYLSNLVAAISPTQALRAKTHELGEAMRHAASNGGLFRSALSGMGSLLGGVATGVAGATAALAAAGVGLAISTARAADFGEAQRRLLMQQQGAVEGARTYQILLEYSNRFGTSVQDTFKQFQDLSRVGFSQPQVIGMMQQIGDVAATVGGDAADGITLALSQIMASTRIQKQDLNQLANRGIALGSMYRELAQVIGTDVTTATRRMESANNGGITKMQLIQAVMQAANRSYSQGGVAGTALTNNLRTLSGQTQLLATRWELMKTRVGETGAFAPVTQFMQKLNEMLDGNTESGKHFQAILNSMFTGLFGAIGKQDPVKMLQSFVSLLHDAGEVAHALGTALYVTFYPVIKAAEALKWVADHVGAGAGVNSAASSRSVEGGIMAERQGGFLGAIGRFVGASPEQIERARTRVSGPAPTPVRPAAQIASRSVSVGNVTVNIEAGAVQSGGMTPAEIGEHAGRSVRDQLSSHLNQSAAQTGNPT